MDPKFQRPTRMLWSIHKGSGWPTQLQKMERWLQRVRTAKNAVDEIDFYLAFFQSCHNFREWLKHTGSISEEALRDYMTDRPELGVCQDLANASKHWALDARRKAYGDYEVALVRAHAPGDRFAHRLLVVGDEQCYAAWDLAQRCLKAWQHFVLTHPTKDLSFTDLPHRFPKNSEVLQSTP